MSDEYRFSRRDALKYAGAGLLSTTFAGTVAGHGGASSEGSDAHAYVEYGGPGRGRLSAIGVHLPQSSLTSPGSAQLDLPLGNTGHFSYVGLDWNPAGHEPDGLFTDPHYDVHFYMPSPSDIAAIPPMFPPNSPTYSIPPELMPAHTFTTEALGLGPRAVVPGMGEHLVTVPSGPGNASSLPDQPGQDGWSVFIWGTFDVDGDGEGRMIFMEPMVTRTYLETLAADHPNGGEVRLDVPMPERFSDGGWYPTEFVVAFDGTDFTIALETFQHFRGFD